MPRIPIPQLETEVSLQEFARGMLGISDVARQLSGFCAGLRNRASDGILTGYGVPTVTAQNRTLSVVSRTP